MKQPATRKDRAQRKLSAAQGDLARLAVAYDWFRAELAVFAAQSGGDTEPAALLTEHIWQAAEMVSEMNHEH